MKYYFWIFIILIFLAQPAAAEPVLADIETAILQKDFEKSQSLAEDFVIHAPDGEQAYQGIYYLGLSQLNLGVYEKARQTFTRLLKRTEDAKWKDKACLGIIDSFLLDGRYVLALTESEKLLKNSPHSEFLSLIYLKIGRANLKLANWHKAEVYLQKIVREFPNSLESHLAKQLLEEKRYFTVQVGAFLDQARALKLKDELKQTNDYVYIIETVDYTGKQFYRVRVGQLSTLKEAESLRQRLAQSGYPTQVYP